MYERFLNDFESVVQKGMHCEIFLNMNDNFLFKILHSQVFWIPVIKTMRYF